MYLSTRVPSWTRICIAFGVAQISACIPHTSFLSRSTLLSSLDLSISPAFHPLNPPQNISSTNTTTLTTWPPTPFDVPIPHPTTPTTLTILRTGRIQPAKDKRWLLAAIAYQQSIYLREGHQPQNFNIWNDDWRFYMELGETPLTMAMAVRTLQVYERLVEEYGMAPMAFLVRVGDDVRGFYWVTVKSAGVGGEMGVV